MLGFPNILAELELLKKFHGRLISKFGWIFSLAL